MENIPQTTPVPPPALAKKNSGVMWIVCLVIGCILIVWGFIMMFVISHGTGDTLGKGIGELAVASMLILPGFVLILLSLLYRVLKHFFVKRNGGHVERKIWLWIAIVVVVIIGIANLISWILTLVQPSY